MTNQEVLSTYNGLQKLKNSAVTMPVYVVFTIVKNIKLLEPIAFAVEETRSLLLSKYATPSPDEPGVFIPLDGKTDILNKELNELSKVDNDIHLTPIELSQLSHMQLTIEEMEALYPMINGEVNY